VEIVLETVKEILSTDR